MIVALSEEFFKDWIFKDGDGFLLKENGVWEEGYFGNVIVSLDYPSLFPLTETKLSDLLGEVRPLPSQMQLHERIMKKRQISPYNLMQLFSEWLMYEELGITDSAWYFVSIDCRWLEYTVYYELGIKWDGEKWQ